MEYGLSSGMNFTKMKRSDIYFSLLILSLSAALTAGCDVDSPEATISFEKKSSMPGNGRASAVAFAVGSKGYVALGRNANHKQLNNCWEYNPSTDTWKQKSSFPGIPRVKATAVVLNSKAYIGLGHNNDSAVYNPASCLRDFWEYTPATDTWRQLTDFPSNFTDACTAFAHNNEIYVGNGFSESGYGGQLWKYLPQENKWIRLNDFIGKSRFGGVVCSDDKRILFGTGFRIGNRNDWWEYRPQSDSWAELQAMPDNGRVNAVALAVGNRYFVATGRHFGGNIGRGHVKSDLQEYNPDTDSWRKAGELPVGARENAVAFVIDGCGYIGLGENDEKVLNDFWSFKP